MKIEFFVRKGGELVSTDEADDMDIDFVFVRLTDEDGHVEEFTVEYWEFIDENKLKKILDEWKKDIFWRRKEQRTKSKEEKLNKIKEVANKVRGGVI